MTSSFAPTVMVDGVLVQPPGWMWVLGFAMAGCDWAIAEADTPEFKARYEQWMKDRHNEQIAEEIASLEKRLMELKQRHLQ